MPKTKLLSIAGVALIAVFLFAVWDAHRSTFSSSRWRSANLMSQARNDMVQDLIDSRALSGKRREQIVELLGPVTETDKFRDWDMVYVLGPQEGYMDHEWLVLRTDRNGAITEQKIVYD